MINLIKFEWEIIIIIKTNCHMALIYKMLSEIISK